MCVFVDLASFKERDCVAVRGVGVEAGQAHRNGERHLELRELLLEAADRRVAPRVRRGVVQRRGALDVEVDLRHGELVDHTGVHGDQRRDVRARLGELAPELTTERDDRRRARSLTALHELAAPVGTGDRRAVVPCGRTALAEHERHGERTQTVLGDRGREVRRMRRRRLEVRRHLGNRRGRRRRPCLECDQRPDAEAKERAARTRHAPNPSAHHAMLPSVPPFGPTDSGRQSGRNSAWHANYPRPR